jgi:hypothetical protein
VRKITAAISGQQITCMLPRIVLKYGVPVAIDTKKRAGQKTAKLNIRTALYLGWADTCVSNDHGIS